MTTGRLRTTALLILGVIAGCATAPETASPSGSGLDATSPPAHSASAPPAAASPDAASASASPSSTQLASDDPLLQASLVDVRSGETFTLADLASDGPVVVETMAIWCTNCRSQMHEVTAAHDLADFHSVSIDVEPSEAAGDLADYAEREGFSWPFVLADAELATQLRERFGTEVLFPPGMPKLLIRPDGSMELLPLGELLSAAEIAAIVEG